MAYEPGSPQVRYRHVERRGFVRRIAGALFATVLGVLAFVGLLVVAAIVLIVVVV